jgi:RNA polymerase sigma factor (sigma-70 family)
MAMAVAIAATASRQGLATSGEGIPDEELLARFLDEEGSASEDAFRVLVGRHGPRVLGICRHILDREHDAEDAFQATFLALARNAASIRDRCALGGWLQEVAYRTALKTRARRSRRRTLERQAMAMTPGRDEPGNPYERASLDELRPVLHEEVTGLPDKYRIPVVLSYLEGKTNEEVANLLHWPVGTVKGRLSRGRALLRSRLMRRGVSLSMAAILLSLSRSRAAAADVPAELLQATLRRALGSGSSAATADLLASPGEPSVELPPAGESAPPPGAQGPSPLRRVRPIYTAILLVGFFAAVLVGGYVSAAALGGKLPDLRSAFSEMMPTFQGGSTPCHPGASR